MMPSFRRLSRWVGYVTWLDGESCCDYSYLLNLLFVEIVSRCYLLLFAILCCYWCLFCETQEQVRLDCHILPFCPSFDACKQSKPPSSCCHLGSKYSGNEGGKPFGISNCVTWSQGSSSGQVIFLWIDLPDLWELWHVWQGAICIYNIYIDYDLPWNFHYKMKVVHPTPFFLDHISLIAPHLASHWIGHRRMSWSLLETLRLGGTMLFSKRTPRGCVV